MFSSRFNRFNGAFAPTRQLAPQYRAFSGTSISRAETPRSTLSTTWVPTGGLTAMGEESGHDKLVRAGFLRQAHSGIFQYLPLGLRVQDKIERLLDKHMRSVGASRLELSTISSEELWRKSDRLEKVSPELFRLSDRKEVPLILSPTHEEEITSLVAGTLKSYKDVPIRLYQITRKYRDERRPRHGLLRSREFLMKDLYTFDLTQTAAIETYRQVSAAYRSFFSELKLPYLVAEASSGDMGGDLSHEYHLPSAVGEDIVVKCNSCGYTANDEVATARSPSTSPSNPAQITSPSQVRVWRGVSKDRKTLVNAWYPQVLETSPDVGLNLHAVKSAFAELDTSIDDPLPLWRAALTSGTPEVVNIIDARLAPVFEGFRAELPLLPKLLGAFEVEHSVRGGVDAAQPLNLVRLANGDGCPRCEEGTLKIHQALECGHTFHLGTRYSEPLDARVTLPQGKLPAALEDEGHELGSSIPVQMGCHGVGVSRIFGAVAELLADNRGLNWPRAIAPFEVAIIPSASSKESTSATDVYDSFVASASRHNFDMVIDDRNARFGWKMKDADLVGYPVVVIVGKLYSENGTCEVQCRRLSVCENVAVEALPEFIMNLLEQL